MNRVLRWGTLFLLGLLALTILSAVVVTVAAAQQPCTSTREQRVAANVTVPFAGDSVHLVSIGRDSVRVRCVAPVRSTEPPVCTSTRVQRVASNVVRPFGTDSVHVYSVGRDSVRVRCVWPVPIVGLELQAVVDPSDTTMAIICPIIVFRDSAKTVRTPEAPLCRPLLSPNVKRPTASQQRDADRVCVTVGSSLPARQATWTVGEGSCDRLRP